MRTTSSTVMRKPYHDRRWKPIRLEVLNHYDWRCQLKLPGCRGRANQVHHIVDWRDGGAPLALSNLTAACVSCNVATRNKRVAARAREARQGVTKQYEEHW